MTIKLNKILKKLKKMGVVAVKQSLEDEGASYDDLLIMRQLTNQVGLKLDIKIGGCEAKNDINFCEKINVNGMVAPMVETDYALRKFIQVVRKNKKQSLYINLESIQAFKNINKILKTEDFKKLKGVVIGRSDLVGSIGLGKESVDSKKTYKLIYPYLKKIKKMKKIVKMGGSVTVKSKSFVNKLFKRGLIHIIETRNIQLKLSNKVILNFENIMNEIFNFEIQWLNYAYLRSRKTKFKLKNDYLQRINILKKRLKN
jgi:4-hydroxy-2-oxoheptanedioate aldolase